MSTVGKKVHFYEAALKHFDSLTTAVLKSHLGLL